MTVAVSRLTHLYPGTTLGISDVDLALGPGELVAVIGASGCGKSTLLRAIAGFLPAQAGTVTIAGVDVTGLPPRARNLGIVFQHYALFPHMTAWENVAYALKVRGIGRADRRRRAADMLALVGLADFADALPPRLSGGQQQRIALARALVFEPAALLLDEPLSALDAALRGGMRDEIRRLQQAHGISTLHVTHDQEEALSMADRVAVMDKGRLVQVAPPRELYDHPATAAIAAFVGHANLWPGRVAGDGRVATAFATLATTTRGHADGAAVTVLVRPERIFPGPPPDGVNGLEGRVVRDRFLGAVRRFDLDVAGTLVLGETSDRRTIAAVHIPPDGIQLIPAERRP
ncbi:MAG: ABC transporter ATP-binding protein [Alphaproteobacteria bacterium]|nr:ABC transporter ATP-binding protein [Alphaproteobacteria bacterium]